MVNPAFTVLFGYQPEEVMGKQAEVFFSSHHDLNPQNGSPANAVNMERRKPCEIACRRKNGEEFIGETVATPVNDDREQLFGIFSIIRDVTRRKAAEKALSEARSKLEIRVNERTEELLRANEEIKRFAYIVSHDLRAPLVNIKGFAAELREAFGRLNFKIGDLLNGLPGESREEISDIIREEIPEALHFIDSSATRMGSLIDAVLKLSRLGRRELHFERVNARVIIQKILDSLAHQIEQKGVNLQIGALPRVVADKTSLEQIFGNILVNAVNYLDPARPGEIEISGESHPTETIYHIRDNGQGIAEDHLEKIFEPFSRFGNRDVPGEGMGLAYVQKLVRRHGGRIWCQSQPGVGTTISFSLSNKPVQEMELA
jgi:PAS domain S-box-containing protein